MHLLNKIYAWILKNYVKVIFFLIGLALDFIFISILWLKKRSRGRRYFSKFYNSYSASDFNEQEHKIVIDEISEIDNASIYLVMLKSIYAAESVESDDLQKL